MDNVKLWEFRFATISAVSKHDEWGAVRPEFIQPVVDMYVRLSPEERQDCANFLRDTMLEAIATGSPKIARAYMQLRRGIEG